jgi:ribonucleoside-diphosphate reductase alpha chain
MAIMFTMSVYSPDIIKFITAKEEEGKIANANISVVVDNVFMQKVENDETYWTEFNGIKYKEYKAKEVFNLIIEGAWRNGEPSLLFKDRIDDSPYKYTEQEILSTNPSMRQGTKILTDIGILPIESLEGKEFKVVNLNGNWSNAKCFLSGRNKKLYKIKLNSGSEYYCTEEHQWPVLCGNGSLIKTFTSELEIGDKLPVSLTEKTYGNLGNYSDGFLIGWIYGDGWITKKTDNNKEQVGIIVSSKDAENDVKEALDIKLKEIGINTSWTIRKNRMSCWYEISTTNEKLIKFLNDFGVGSKEDGLPTKIWNDCSKDFVLGFLDGIISSDGYIDKNRIVITSSHQKLAKELEELLGFLGICAICNIRESYGNFNLDKTYIAYDICFSTRFANNWNITNKYKNDNLRQLIKERDYYFRTIKSIEETNFYEDVWDIRVFDETHCFALSDVITGNCSEQPLPPNGVCNLGALDLSKFFNKKLNSIDYIKLELATRLSVNFLDCVVTESSYPTEDITKWSKENRAIGLGIMGFADCCLQKEIAYGSDESIKELEEILKFIYNIAKNESEILGKINGVPKMCQLLPEPRRNITLTTIAPTGTTSIIAGCSSGIEPIFSEITIRNDKTGTYQFENDLASKPYFRCAVSSDGTKEVSWEEHVKILASAQKFIDSGVSKTANFPNHTHRDTIAKAFIMAWKMNCKGLAVYRNGSRKVEVLSPKNLKKDKCPSCGGELAIIKNCKKCLSCSWNLCEE